MNIKFSVMKAYQNYVAVKSGSYSAADQFARKISFVTRSLNFDGAKMSLIGAFKGNSLASIGLFASIFVMTIAMVSYRLYDQVDRLQSDYIAIPDSVDCASEKA